MENFMEKQTEYEQEIDLVSLFFAVLHKYRQIFAAAVACAVLFGAVGMFKHVRSQKAAEAASENGEEIVRRGHGRIPCCSNSARQKCCELQSSAEAE